MGSLQSAILGFGAFRVLQKAGIAGFETFTVSEIVIVQTTAVATATMPLAAGASLHLEPLPSCRARPAFWTGRCWLMTRMCAHHQSVSCQRNCSWKQKVATAGLVGIIPALSEMSPEQNPPDGPITLSTAQLLAWSAALAFFGVFLAVPLRSQTIIREKLR